MGLDAADRSRGRRLVAIALLPLGVGGCGPSGQETGEAVLTANPVALLVGLAVVHLLLRLWRRRHPDLSMDWKPGLFLLLVCTFAAGCVLPMMSYNDLEDWVLQAIWLWGTSYVSLLVVTWRIWFRLRPASAFTWSPFAPLVLGSLPAIALAGDLAPIDLEWVLWYYLWPGYLGWSTAVLLPAVFLEAWLRTRRSRRPDRAGAL